MNSRMLEEEGWTTVGRKKRFNNRSMEDYGREETTSNFRRGFRDSSFTIFVDLLPVFMDNHMLRGLFRECERVIDAFIPRRPRRFSKEVYGFVRYATKEEALWAVKKMNGRRVHGREIFVGLEHNMKVEMPKGRSGAGRRDSRGVGEVIGKRAYVEVVKGGMKDREKAEGKIARGNDYSQIKVGYPEKLINGRKKVILNEAKFSYEDRSFIGKIQNGFKVIDIKSKILGTVKGVLEVRYLGGPFVLVVFDNIDNVEEATKVIDNLKIFASFTPWFKKISNKYRVCWLRCVGIPLSAWSIDSLEKIGSI